jgi:hypothetical protein
MSGKEQYENNRIGGKFLLSSSIRQIRFALV